MKIHLAYFQLDLSRGDSRNLQKIVDEPDKVVGLSFDHREKLVHRLARGVIAKKMSQDRDGVANWREGVAQLMGQGRQEFVLFSIGGLELFERVSGFVLQLPRLDGGAGCADKSPPRHRSFEKAYIGTRLECA
ncbi:hypothetical protein LMG27198_38960 [Methylocystis echinoides]|uniref:Uncharacterized protein n=1 Tax=Methylocystis echinoides TaxID=29468 RepID=A0A9W6GXN2_9HYPH|nr:hypothetical protein LMG27198_38960 [Methylocystis echinoides]